MIRLQASKFTARLLQKLNTFPKCPTLFWWKYRLLCSSYHRLPRLISNITFWDGKMHHFKISQICIRNREHFFVVFVFVWTLKCRISTIHFPSFKVAIQWENTAWIFVSIIFWSRRMFFAVHYFVVFDKFSTWNMLAIHFICWGHKIRFECVEQRKEVKTKC